MKLLHNTSRIEAFSDAVLAFAATLMVISLNPSDNMAILRIGWTEFISFGVSFFALILIWKVHYDFFRRTKYIDNWVIALNSILLFVVLYYVFPLRSLASVLFEQKQLNEKQVASLFIMYGLGFLLMFLCISLMYLRAYKKDNTGDDKLELQFQARHFAGFVLVALISILLSTFKIGTRIGLPGFIYALIGPVSYFNAVWFKKHNKNIQNI